MPAAEFKYWMDDGEMSRRAGRAYDRSVKNNRRVFEAALQKKVTPYEWGKEIAPGLLSVESVGHTPGHTSFILSSGSDRVFIQSDVTNNPVLFVSNPGWHANFDQDGEVAEATRRKVMTCWLRTGEGARLPFSVSRARQCREGRQRLSPCPGAVVAHNLSLSHAAILT